MRANIAANFVTEIFFHISLEGMKVRGKIIITDLTSLCLCKFGDQNSGFGDRDY